MTMAHSTEEPEVCLWPLDPACLETTWDALDPEVKARAQMLASMTLFALCGQRVGGCPVTVRPSLEMGRCYIGADPIGPGDLALAPYAYMNAFYRGDRGILLPPPVHALVEVNVDGVALNLSDFRIDDGRRLVWQGTGASPLPIRQNLSQPAGAPGTFSVTYQDTAPVSPAGAYAAGALAMEYAKACTGSKCRLPSNVTTLVRQGVTMNFTEGVFPKGRTTIPEVDRFIGLWNPRGIRAEAQVWSPHVSYPTKTTWEA